MIGSRMVGKNYGRFDKKIIFAFQIMTQTILRHFCHSEERRITPETLQRLEILYVEYLV